MVRPKKGTEGHFKAVKRWRETMLNKYGGDKDALHKAMQARGAMGGKLSNNGGFASDKIGVDGLTGRERSRIAGAKGGRISRRGSAKKEGDDEDF